MTSSASWSITSVSVAYETIDVGLYLHDGRDIKYAPLDKASELVASMPYAALTALLAPIKEGLVDPQTAFYRIDDKREGKIDICVEDFMQLASSCLPNEEAREMVPKIVVEDDANPDCGEDDSVIPPRLLDALRLVSDELYSTIDEDTNSSSSGYLSQSTGKRTRLYSTISEQSTVSLPVIPYSRPPHDGRNRSISLISVNQQIQRSEQTSRLHSSQISLSRLGDSEIYVHQQQQHQLQLQPLQVVQLQHLQRQKEQKLAIDEDLPIKKGISLRGKLLALVLAALIILGIAALIYFILFRRKGTEIAELVRKTMPEFSSYWIGIRGWKGSWYMDDESNVTFLNFFDSGAANQSIVNSADDTVEINSGCVQVDASGVWSTMYCDQMRPFVCERNTASNDVRRTPFYPYQEKKCASVGGRCVYDVDCNESTDHIIINLCPKQALNIRCCVPNKPEPSRMYNSSMMTTCAEAGGVCNHVSEDECRNGRVVFDLKVPCPDRPRKLECCVQNELVSKIMPEFSSYWIGIRGWKGSWYMDDESNVTFLNFFDSGAANQSIVNSADDTVEINSGCVEANKNGIWSTMYCDQMRPFVCERNTASNDIQRTPFYPYQEKTCARAGGRCVYDVDCNNNTDHIIINLCPKQALNIRCCVPNVPKPSGMYNSSMNTCAAAGGVCNHVSEDECRNGRVVFDLKTPCPDRPRKRECCVQNGTVFW